MRARGEYIREGTDIHANTMEGFFGIFKRGIRGGVYQHCGSQHLQRYIREFDFRYSHPVALGVNDGERCEIALSRGSA